MKGVILAGGKGTRLRPLTYITNKHLLPLYDKPMIEYPIATLVNAGIKEILVVSGREHAGHFVNYLGSGTERGLKFSYRVQEEAGGIAQALALAEDFVDGDKFAVILGDNIFEDNFTETFKEFEQSTGARVFTKEVDSPQRFGVIREEDGIPVEILEKPKEPPTNKAVTGLYLYDRNAFDVIRTMKPSARGELEITDVNNWYMNKKWCTVQEVKGFWSDAGTFESMLASSNWAGTK